MNLTKSVVISLLVTAILLFLAGLFWPFVVHNILEPTAMAVWLLLRILVLSIHQKYFWYTLIFAALIVLFRVLRPQQTVLPSDAYRETNTTITNIGYWRALFTYNGQNVRDDRHLRRELTYLLTCLYAAKQGTSNNFQLQDAFEQGKIPLPEHIHTFLFPPKPSVSGGLLKRFFRSIQKTPQKWIRTWTGQEKAEHYQIIDEVLNFMETSLEMKNDDTKLLQNKH